MSKRWLQAAREEQKREGTQGVFSAAAKRAGMSTVEYAHHVMNNPKASGLLKKRANFALNAIGARAGK